MPYQRLARHVLAEWRLLERRLAAIEPGSREAEQLLAESHAFRDEYQHLIDAAEIHHRPKPPPFPKEPIEVQTSERLVRYVRSCSTVVLANSDHNSLEAIGAAT